MDWVDDSGGEYLAGHRAPPGAYRRAAPPDGRTVVLEDWGVLPASLDGQVAVYVRVERPPVLVASGRPRPRRPVAPD